MANDKKMAHNREKMGACRNSFFCVFGIFLAKKSSQSSKFQRGNIFTWVVHSGAMEDRVPRRTYR